MTPEQFITRWQHASGSELANAQSFVRELAELRWASHRPIRRVKTPATTTMCLSAASSSATVTAPVPKGASTATSVAIVLEAKKLKLGAQTKGYDDAMLCAPGPKLKTTPAPCRLQKAGRRF